MLNHRGASLVVSGSNNVGEQVLVNAINDMLGNYGATIDFANASHQRQGLDSNIQGLIAEMNAGRVSRSNENLETLANMWRQAREFERAIPVLMRGKTA